MANLMVSLLHPVTHQTPGGARLTPLEFAGLGFVPQRDFLLTGADPGAFSGGHAHRTCHQVFRCVAGATFVRVRAPSGIEETFPLAPHGPALHVPPGYWVEIQGLRACDTFLVTCSHAFDPADYVRDPAAFRALAP